MIYKTQEGQVSSGEAIGILLLDTSVPFIPGDVANATTYPFPVRFKMVDGFTVPRAIGKDPAVFDSLLAAAQELAQQGVRAITGDCGFMGIHQKKLAKELKIPVFLSSLLQIPFIRNLIAVDAKVGIITADSRSLDADLLAEVGVPDASNLVIRGLEDQRHFYQFAIEETGSLDSEAVEAEEPAEEEAAREPAADKKAPRAAERSFQINEQLLQGLQETNEGFQTKQVEQLDMMYQGGFGGVQASEAF